MRKRKERKREREKEKREKEVLKTSETERYRDKWTE